MKIDLEHARETRVRVGKQVAKDALKSKLKDIEITDEDDLNTLKAKLKLILAYLKQQIKD